MRVKGETKEKSDMSNALKVSSPREAYASRLREGTLEEGTEQK